MRQLMQQGRVVGLLRGACGRSGKVRPQRQLDAVCRWAIVSARSAMVDHGSGCLDESFCRLNRLNHFACRRLKLLEAIDLLGGEDW
jgi:hypothetical protein